MKFTFENLGYIDKGEIVLGDITLICGDNNTGKTYINYGIYGLLYSLKRNPKITIDKSAINDLITNGKTIIDLKSYIDNFKNIISENSTDFIEELPVIFSSNESLFKESKFYFDLLDYECSLSEFDNRIVFVGGDNISIIFTRESNSSLLSVIIDNKTNENIPVVLLEDILTRIIFEIIIGNKVKNPFIITSERTGVSLFWKELDINKNILIDKILKTKNVNIPDLFTTDLSRYPISIKHNIDVIRDVKEILNIDSDIKKNNKESYDLLMMKFNELIGGKFKIYGDEIFLEPKKLNKRKKTEPLPLHLASSASRSVLLLYIYINSIAKKNDILLIDEPELNLHPSKQIIMAKLLANLVNIGINVLITTHSDFIVKEINNLIMLSNEFSEKDRIIKEHDYVSSDILKPEQVKAYFTGDQHLSQANVDNYGINFDLFDDTIKKINLRSNDIYYSLED